jgi:hypothetical protein
MKSVYTSSLPSAFSTPSHDLFEPPIDSLEKPAPVFGPFVCAFMFKKVKKEMQKSKNAFIRGFFLKVFT